MNRTSPERYKVLLEGYLDRQLNADELNEFYAASGTVDHENYLDLRLEQDLEMRKFTGSATPELAETVYQTIIGSGRASKPVQPRVHRIHFLKTAWFRYAAIVLVTAGLGVYLFNVAGTKKSPDSVANTPADFLPGREGAVLTLADGSQVVLDSIGNGVIATQNGTKVVLSNGQLAYNISGEGSGDMMYNTVSTPKGRLFSVLLPDGTRVWLNAASSIRYPTFFSGNERRVNVSGEAYFEVEKNSKKPFIVNINGQGKIEVLGTSFNVNAYDNEELIKTTLITGSVSVSNTQRVVLGPGEQAQMANISFDGKKEPEIKVAGNTDIGKIMAWKNGLFNFGGVSLQEAMRQLERWYDIEVKYVNAPPKTQFGGKIQRSLKLSQILVNLADENLEFSMNGKILYVKSK